MRTKIILALALIAFPSIGNAQTNTFPSSGNVGIGTSPANAKLDVKGTNSGVPTAHFDLVDNTSENFSISQGTNNYFVIDTSNSLESIIIGNDTTSPIIFLDGSVGIGTNNPGNSKFMIKESGNDLVDFRFATGGTGQLEFVGWHNGWNINSKIDGKHLYLNRDAGANSNVTIGRREGKELFVRGSDGFTGIGTSTPDHRLDVIGTIRAHEIIVSTEGADFVFEENYELRSLSEVELHIEAYGHLPEIPSAEVMQAEGIAVSELQTKLLQKVEELTLYMIEKDKQIEVLQAKVAELESN